MQLDVSEATRKVCVAVVILQDSANEGDETFVLRMSTSDEETEILQSTVKVTIVNSDSELVALTSFVLFLVVRLVCGWVAECLLKFARDSRLPRMQVSRSYVIGLGVCMHICVSTKKFEIYKKKSQT